MSPQILAPISLMILALSLAWMHRLIRILKFPLTIPGVFYVAYVVFIYAGALPVYYMHPGPAADRYLLAVHAVLLLMPFGMALASMVLRFNPTTELPAYLQANISPVRHPFYVPFLIATVASVVLSVLYVARLTSVPLLQLISPTTDYVTLVRSREAATGLFSGSYYLYSLSFNVALPFLTYLAWAQARHTRQRRYKVLSRSLLAFACFMLLSSLQKAPVVMFLLGLYILVVLVSRRFTVRRAVPVLLAVVLLATCIVFLLSRQLAGNALERALVSLQAVFRRAFIGQTEPLYYYFEVFPQQHPFAHGATIGALSRLLGLTFFPASRFVHAFRYPNRITELGSSNSAFIADMYANFGFATMLLSIVLVGSLLQVVQVCLTRSRKTPLTLALYSFLCIAFAKLSQTSLTTTLSSFGVIWAYVIVFYFRASASFLARALTASRKPRCSTTSTVTCDQFGG